MIKQVPDCGIPNSFLGHKVFVEMRAHCSVSRARTSRIVPKPKGSKRVHIYATYLHMYIHINMHLFIVFVLLFIFIFVHICSYLYDVIYSWLLSGP